MQLENGKDKKYGIHNGQPLNLDRNDEKQQNNLIGIKRREGEKHGEVDIRGTYRNVCMKREVGNQSIDNGKQHSGNIVQREAGRAPASLQCRANKIRKVQRNDGPDPVAVRNDDKRDKPPDLPVQNMVGAKQQKLIQGSASVHRSQQPDYRIGDYNEQHHIGNSKTRMTCAEAVNSACNFSHGASSFSGSKNVFINHTLFRNFCL